MAIRPSVPSGDDDAPAGDTVDDFDDLDEAGAEPPEPVTEVDWRVDQPLMVIKFVLAVIFVAGPWVVTATATSRVMGLLVGAGLLVAGVRDVLAPVRLHADPAGVTVVSGFAGRRRLSWSEIERVRLDSRARFGMRAEYLEVDAGESLHFFSRYDLGVPPTDALDTIRRIRGVSR